MKPISVQLYSLREEAQDDFVGALRSVAEIGFKGVEPAGLFGLDPADARKIIEDLGMVVSSNHGPWPNRDNLDEVIDVAGGLGTKLVVCGFQREQFEAVDGINEAADTVNFMLEKVNQAGLTLAIHNHWWEFCEIGGRLGYDILMEQCPKLQCELDTYWAANFGACDPVEQVAKYKDRTPLLHIKDGPLVKDEAQVAVGSGKMDVPSVIAAADESVLQWLVVEIDNCDTDMTTAVAESYDFLTEKGLAAGNK